MFAARPDVLNHNLETVPRLQRAVRPSAGYARSLAAARPRQGCRSRHEVGAHRRHGRDRRRGRRHARRPARGRRRHRHDRPVPAADDPSPPGRAMGSRRRRSSGSRREGEELGIGACRGLAVDPLELPRPRRLPPRRSRSRLRAVPCRHDRADFRVRRSAGEGPRGDGRQGHRRAAALGRRRPAVPHRATRPCRSSG